jgi:hypothetical protein
MKGQKCFINKNKQICKDDFQCCVMSNDYVFVIFHSSHCGHCINLLQNIGITGEELNIANNKVIMGTKDKISVYFIPENRATEDLKISLNVPGYPAIYLCYNNNIIPFIGNDMQQTDKYLSSKNFPNITRSNLIQMINKFMRDTDFVTTQ